MRGSRTFSFIRGEESPLVLRFNIDQKNNNPSLSEAIAMADVLEILESNNLLSESKKKIIKDVKLNILALRATEKFNDIFKDTCWVINGYLPVAGYFDSVKEALNNDMVKAENALVNGVASALDLFMIQIMRYLHFNGHLLYPNGYRRCVYGQSQVRSRFGDG